MATRCSIILSFSSFAYFSSITFSSFIILCFPSIHTTRPASLTYRVAPSSPVVQHLCSRRRSHPYIVVLISRRLHLYYHLQLHAIIANLAHYDPLESHKMVPLTATSPTTTIFLILLGHISQILTPSKFKPWLTCPL